MIQRVFAAALFCFALSAHADDLPIHCKGANCEPPAPVQPVPAPQPANGFCDGVYDGFLAAEAGPLSLEVQTSGDCGQVSVTAHWQGNVWVGQGICQAISANQASIVFQFPNTPMQRGMVSVGSDGQAELDGQVDGGDSFRLMRH